MKNTKLVTAQLILVPLLFSSFSFAAVSAGEATSPGSSLLLESQVEDVNGSGSDDKIELETFASDVNIDVYNQWWLSWNEIENSALINEGNTCDTLAAKPTISTAQQTEIIGNGCTSVVFYDSFDSEEGNKFKPLGSGTPVVALPYGSLKKWNSYDNGIMLLRHNSIWAQADRDNEGYVLSLATIHGSSRIETKGGIDLEEGHYKLLVKFKAGTQKILSKYVGVTTKIEGTAVNIKQHDYVQSLYTNPQWEMISISFNVYAKDRVIITMEDIFNGMRDRGAMIDDVILYQVSETPII